MLINLKKVCLTTLLVMSPLFVSADEPNMKLFGTLLIPPPCVIENNNLIEVYFGHNVGIHRVDGINYTQPVNYRLKCDPNIKGWDLGLSIIGPKSQFDDAGLQTNITGLSGEITKRSFKIKGSPFRVI